MSTLLFLLLLILSLLLLFCFSSLQHGPSFVDSAVAWSRSTATKHLYSWRLVRIARDGVFFFQEHFVEYGTRKYRWKDIGVICRLQFYSLSIWIFGQRYGEYHLKQICVWFFFFAKSEKRTRCFFVGLFFLAPKANCIFMLNLIQSYGSMIFIELRIRWYIDVIHLQVVASEWENSVDPWHFWRARKVDEKCLGNRKCILVRSYRIFYHSWNDQTKTQIIRGYLEQLGQWTEQEFI